MKEPIALVCAAANSPLTVRGSSFNRRCSACQVQVMIAPSGERRLRAEPEIIIVCLGCARRLGKVRVLPQAPDQIAESNNGPVTNYWRIRN